MCFMSTQWERLNSELSKKHKSWASLADHLGLQKQNVGNWKSRGIPAKYLRKCAEFVSRSHDWLDLGDETQSGAIPPNYKPNQPLAGVSIAQGAIDINVNRRAQPTAQAVLGDLSALLAGVDPGLVASVAGMLSDLARNPTSAKLLDALAGLLTPEAFVQAERKQM